jgi:hypothetical protein
LPAISKVVGGAAVKGFLRLRAKGETVEYGPASARVPLLGEQRLYLPMIARQ